MGAERKPVEITFTNELGNVIRIAVHPSKKGFHLITMEGPNSTAENHVTQSEIDNLFRALGAYLGAPVQPAYQEVVITGAPPDLSHLARLSEAAQVPRPLESHTDDGLIDLLAEACDAYEDMAESLGESGGRGGSPMEGVEERVEEIVTEVKRRGLPVPVWATTPGGRRPKEN